MPDNPTLPYVLKVNAGSNTDAGATTVIENVTQINSNDMQKNKEIKNLDSAKSATFDIANLRSGYSNGDSILIKVVGLRVGRAVHTVDTSKAPKAITLSETSADYAGAAISL